jgi:hypothetical protein
MFARQRDLSGVRLHWLATEAGERRLLSLSYSRHQSQVTPDRVPNGLWRAQFT